MSEPEKRSHYIKTYSSPDGELHISKGPKSNESFCGREISFDWEHEGQGHLKYFNGCNACWSNLVDVIESNPTGGSYERK